MESSTILKKNLTRAIDTKQEVVEINIQNEPYPSSFHADINIDLSGC
jgi:hypothetical protein